jgi:hypothetical protein
MFIPTWNKYLPAIRILLKRSVNADQKLDMNSTDFHRAAGGRKIKYVFNILLEKGRVQTNDVPSPLARDLIAALQQDSITYKFIRQSQLQISMNNSFQLTIKNQTPPAEPEQTSDEEPETVNENKSGDKAVEE